MAQEVQKLKSLELGEDEQSAVFQFLKEYGLLVSGKDPSRDLD